MATYKVIQDIEAEDHILGPLTLRQFLYLLGSILFVYLSFLALSKHAGFMLVIFLPPAMLFGFFAFPFRSDQPTEVWALARLRFLFKPRRRLWSQSGLKELVTITAPKKIEKRLTNGLSQTEVDSRLQALALMIDSRGWVIKNSTAPLGSSSVIYPEKSDRLVDVASIPRPVPDYEFTPSDDILDEQNNPIAQQMNNRIVQITQEHRQNLINSLKGENKTTKQAINGSTAPAQITNASTQAIPTSMVTPKTQRPDPTAAALSEVQIEDIPKPQPPKSPDPAILNLSKNNDHNISTLAREANEIVVNLH